MTEFQFRWSAIHSEAQGRFTPNWVSFLRTAIPIDAICSDAFTMMSMRDWMMILIPTMIWCLVSFVDDTCSDDL